MRKTVEYCVEYKIKGEPCYRKSFNGFRDKSQAIKCAENSIRDQIIAVRVVEQTRRVIEVFNSTKI